MGERRAKIKQWLCMLPPAPATPSRNPRPCRLIRFHKPAKARRAERPARTLSTEIAALILARWGFPASSENLDAVEGACKIPLTQLSMLSASLPRTWICSPGPAVGARIAEA